MLSNSPSSDLHGSLMLCSPKLRHLAASSARPTTSSDGCSREAAASIGPVSRPRSIKLERARPQDTQTRSACRTGPSSAFSMQKVRPSTLIDPWVPASTSSLLRCFSPERVKSAASSDRPESDAVYSNDITAIYGHRINSGTVSSPSPVGRPQALNPSGCSGTKDQQPPSVL